jgi:RimJ/RimL family protein N-acetyltransferase
LRLFVEQTHERPLHAVVAEHNAASLRVLDKCGFAHVGAPRVAHDGVVGISLASCA